MAWVGTEEEIEPGQFLKSNKKIETTVSGRPDGAPEADQSAVVGASSWRERDRRNAGRSIRDASGCVNRHSVTAPDEDLGEAQRMPLQSAERFQPQYCEGDVEPRSVAVEHGFRCGRRVARPPDGRSWARTRR